MFSREFKIDQILILWDAIFSIGKNLLFIDFLSIVILLSLKYKIVKKDQDNTFQIIFGFNQKNKINVIKFIAEAKDLMDRYYQRKNMNIPMSYYDNKRIFNNGINDDDVNDDDDDVDQEKPFYSGININKNNDNNNNNNNNDNNDKVNNNIINNNIEEENKNNNNNDNNNDNNKNNIRKNLFGEEVPINNNNNDIINNKNNININNNIDSNNNNIIKRQNLFNREEPEFENKIQPKNEKNNNSSIINTKIESTKKYLSGAVSQIGSFFKDVVNKEFQKIENNNNNNDIYYNSQEIANNVSNLEYLLNKYKNNFNEDDLNLFQFSIRFFKMCGKSFENK